MKVLLLNPPSFSAQRLSRGLMGGYGMNVGERLVYPPIQLAYVAAALESAGHDVEIVDAEAAQTDPAVVLDAARQSEAEVIGMPCSQDAFEDEMAFCRTLGEATGTLRVLFGPMAQNHADDCLQAGQADFVILGEPDLAFAELLEADQEGRIDAMPGIVFRRDQQTVRNEGLHRVEDLDTLPLPARHLLDHRLYHYPGSRQRMTTIHSSRGCPIDCPFCAYVFTEGKRLRERSAANIVEEMREAHEEHGIALFVFRDPIFTLNRGRILEMCSELARLELNLEWICETALRFLDDELLETMRAAGCTGLSFGVESANAELQEKYAKNKIGSKEHAEAIVETCKRLGIRTRAFFMLGFPEDTDETIDETIDFAIRLDPVTIQFVPVTVYAGTPLYDELGSSREGIYDPAVHNSIRRAYRRFYGRPARLATELRNPGALLRKTGRYLSMRR